MNEALFKALIAFDGELRKAGVGIAPDIVFHDLVDWLAAVEGIPCIGSHPPTMLGYAFRYQRGEGEATRFVDEEIGA